MYFLTYRIHCRRLVVHVSNHWLRVQASTHKSVSNCDAPWALCYLCFNLWFVSKIPWISPPDIGHILICTASVNRKVAESRAAGIFIRDTACFQCHSMNCDSLNHNEKMPHPVRNSWRTAFRNLHTIIMIINLNWYTLITEPPESLWNISVGNYNSSCVTLIWHRTSGAPHYKIHYWRTADDRADALIESVMRNDENILQQHSICNLSSGTLYHFEIESQDRVTPNYEITQRTSKLIFKLELMQFIP